MMKNFTQLLSNNDDLNDDDDNNDDPMVNDVNDEYHLITSVTRLLRDCDNQRQLC